MLRYHDWKYVYYHGYDSQLFNLNLDPDEVNNLAGLKDYEKIEKKLENKLLNEWNPLEIEDVINKKSSSKKILKAWAESVQPADKYKWETKVEDNWLN